MPARKRTADEAGATSTGTTKSARTSSPTRPKGGKKGPKGWAPMRSKHARCPYISTLLTLPPSIPDEETEPAASADPGFIGTTALIPTTFTTGSYGWKGSKRLTIELPDPEGGKGKEKVHVMLTINATVMGSKQAKDDGGEAKESTAPAEEEPAEAEESSPGAEPQEAKVEAKA